MKILLCYPRKIEIGDWKPPAEPNTLPLGIAYLGASLKNMGYEVSLYNFFYYPNWEEIKKVFIKEKPNIVGCTCLTEQRRSSIKILSLAKEIDPEIITILGGPHATLMSDQILNYYSDVDLVVLGEGEETMVNIAQVIETKSSFHYIRGIAFRENQIVYTNQNRPLLDITKIPHPILDAYDRNYNDDYFLGNKSNMAPIIFSRGCNQRCVFCSTSKVWRGYRFRDIEDIIQEIKECLLQNPQSYFDIVDDTSSFDIDLAKKLWSRVIANNLKVRSQIATRVDKIDEELLRLMRTAGVERMIYGAESGSQRILDNIKKNQTVEQIKRAFVLSKQIGFKTFMLLMVGNPGENGQTIEETCRLIKEVKPDIISPMETMIFPGTELYDLAKEQGLLDDSYWLTDKPQPYYTIENSLEKLRGFKWLLYQAHKESLI